MNKASKSVSFVRQAKCCGAEKPTDWADSKWIRTKIFNGTGRVPPSCCSDKRDNCTVGEPGTYTEVMTYHLMFKIRSPLRLCLVVY